MFKEKLYTFICHGCGTVHQQKAFFVSTTICIDVIDHTGKHWTVGCVGCANCMEDPAKPIREAYENGLKLETIAAAQKNWAAFKAAEAAAIEKILA